MSDEPNMKLTESMDDPTTANYDAEQMTEAIKKDGDKAPRVNVDADYERSKQFDVAGVDQEDSEAAAEKISGDGTGDPHDYLNMAKQVTPKSNA
jgi:hypothetical protein